MRVDLLHVPDCPNRDRARARLHAALGEAQITASVREVEVDSVTTAVATGMQGSPTILIDGCDPFPSGPGGASLSCRLFATADGIDGAPSIGQLVEALSRRRTDANND